MKWPTLEQLQAASATGNKNYLAEQEAELSRCLCSWRAGVCQALNSVVHGKSRTYRVSVTPGGSYSPHTVRMAHDILATEIRKAVPGIWVQDGGEVDSISVTWDPAPLGLQ